MPIFRYSLAAAMDKAEAEQRACEEALVEARMDVAAEQRRAHEIDEKTAAARQRIAEARDNLTRLPAGGGASALAAVFGFMAAETARVAEFIEMRRRQEAEVRFAEHKVVLRTRELGDATSRLEALKRMRTIEQKEHERMLRRSEEQVQEELATLKLGRMVM